MRLSEKFGAVLYGMAPYFWLYMGIFRFLYFRAEVIWYVNGWEHHHL